MERRRRCVGSTRTYSTVTGAVKPRSTMRSTAALAHAPVPPQLRTPSGLRQCAARYARHHRSSSALADLHALACCFSVCRRARMRSRSLKPTVHQSSPSTPVAPSFYSSAAASFSSSRWWVTLAACACALSLTHRAGSRIWADPRSFRVTSALSPYLHTYKPTSLWHDQSITHKSPYPRRTDYLPSHARFRHRWLGSGFTSLCASPSNTTPIAAG